MRGDFLENDYYKPAELSKRLESEILRLETQIRKDTHREIVLIAYEPNHVRDYSEQPVICNDIYGTFSDGFGENIPMRNYIASLPADIQKIVNQNSGRFQSYEELHRFVDQIRGNS